jgi:hypothetical protein
MKNVKIIVATHKKYEMPKDELYLPIHVGSEGKQDIGFTKDNTGDNISLKNPYYCELTGLYWAWKNLDADYIGLVHYRRHFASKIINKKDLINSVLTSKEVDDILNDTNIIVPKKRHYYIENLYSHYAHTLYVEPLDITGKIIEEKYPEYISEFNKLKKRTSAHMFNMAIMSKNLLDEYCTWLFDILFELEKRVDSTKYDAFHSRFYGRVSELLLDVWINTKGYSYKEVRVVSIGKVNWWIKGTSFLKAKFLGKKYEKSF